MLKEEIQYSMGRYLSCHRPFFLPPRPGNETVIPRRRANSSPFALIRSKYNFIYKCHWPYGSFVIRLFQNSKSNKTVSPRRLGLQIFCPKDIKFPPLSFPQDFWFAALYKALVGTTVLSVKSSYSELPTYVHCTKPSTRSNPNNYEAGSVTIFGTNVHSTEDVQVTLKTSPSRDETAHIYVLTCDEVTG